MDFPKLYALLATAFTPDDEMLFSLFRSCSEAEKEVLQLTMHNLFTVVQPIPDDVDLDGDQNDQDVDGDQNDQNEESTDGDQNEEADGEQSPR